MHANRYITLIAKLKQKFNLRTRSVSDYDDWKVSLSENESAPIVSLSSSFPCVSSSTSINYSHRSPTDSLSILEKQRSIISSEKQCIR